jgi:hypothetical protein
MAQDTWLYIPQQTQTCTDALYRFISEYDRIIALFFFIIQSATRMDEMQSIAAKALAEGAAGEKPTETFNRKTSFKRVQEFSSVISRNLIVGMANNFHCYLSESLQGVVMKRHEILRSGERITTEDILQFGSMQDLRAYIADKKINELSYGGIKQMQEFISDRLCVEMFTSSEQQALLTIFVELRNIHTHNRGIVNQLFLDRIGAGHKQFNFTLAKLFHVDFDNFILLSKNAIEVALHVDDALARKFKIRRSHYKKRLAKERASKNLTTLASSGSPTQT